MHPWAREIRDYLRLLDESEKGQIKLAFYAETRSYYKYYVDFIKHILKMSSVDIHYLASDSNDPMLEQDEGRIKSYYVRNALGTLMAGLRANVVVMTTPDLGQYYLRRSPRVQSYVYAFHGVFSTHFGYRPGAFDHYDTILCVGPHHIRELRKAEEIAHRKPASLVECGYPLLERMCAEHATIGCQPSTRPTVLVASSWGKQSITGCCVEQVVECLSRSEFNVILRPHPEFLRKQPREFRRLQQLVSRYANTSLDLALSGEESLHRADLLITDGSGISFEYALATERPVLFLAIPVRIENPRYEELGIEPIDLSLRDQIGKVVSLSDLSQLSDILIEMQQSLPAWRERIVQCRDQYIFNWMRSAEVGAAAILEHVSEGAPTEN
jgi:YidC/Oxa1 family membrane protein insertase